MLRSASVKVKAFLEVFTEKLVKTIQGCDLFLTLSFHKDEYAKKLYHLLCLQGIYCRLADEQDTLRFGIAVAENFKRLENACRHACIALTQQSNDISK